MAKRKEPSNLGQALGVTPGQMASLLILGFTLFQQGRNEEAKNLFEGILLLDPSSPYAHHMMGSIHQHNQHFRKAIDAYTRALQTNPKQIDALTNRGECHLNLGQFQEAAADFHMAIQLDTASESRAANRARFLIVLTAEALKLANEDGVNAVVSAKQRIDQQLTP